MKLPMKPIGTENRENRLLDLDHQLPSVHPPNPLYQQAMYGNFPANYQNQPFYTRQTNEGLYTPAGNHEILCEWIISRSLFTSAVIFSGCSEFHF